MRFTKMHGAGNDYIFVDCFREPVPEDLPQTAVAVSNRHTGIGGDGLILICPSEKAHARMRMFNADGSVGEMCGNGIRCVAKYLYDHGIAVQKELDIETDGGILTLQVEAKGGRVDCVRVNMGPPILAGSSIPTTLPGNPPLETLLEVAGRRFAVTCVSMGNPHCVTFVEDLNDDWVHTVGPAIERHSAFPNRVNVEFVHVVSPAEIVMRVWERGSGETQACGTGAGAAVVAGVLTKRTDNRITAHLPGGDLELEWHESGDVYMTGPAVEVYHGEWTPGKMRCI